MEDHRACAACGEALPPYAGRGRPRRTCSEACRSKLKRQKQTRGRDQNKGWRHCNWCGKGFRQKHAAGPRPKFCSESCREAADRQRNHPAMREALHQLALRAQKHESSLKLYRWADRRLNRGKPVPLCRACGRIFYYQRGSAGRPKVYCRASCRKKGYVQRWGECPECGERFDRTDSPGRVVKVYCSESCGNLAKARQYRERQREMRVAGAEPPTLKVAPEDPNPPAARQRGSEMKELLDPAYDHLWGGVDIPIR